MFDTTKKKKKKKKVFLDLDALEEQNTNVEDKSEIVSEIDNKNNEVTEEKADDKGIICWWSTFKLQISVPFTATCYTVVFGIKSTVGYW